MDMIPVCDLARKSARWLSPGGGYQEQVLTTNHALAAADRLSDQGPIGRGDPTHHDAQRLRRGFHSMKKPILLTSIPALVQASNPGGDFRERCRR